MPIVAGMKHRHALAAAVTLAAVTALIGYGTTTVQATEQRRPAACVTPSPEMPPPTAVTTVTTVGQAFHCIYDNHFSGPALDARTLLVPAFAAVTQELQRRGLDRANATLPALTGRRDPDWAAFRRAYEQLRLPAEAETATARVAVDAMIDALRDDHAHVARGALANTTGLVVDAMRGPFEADPAATAPMFVTRVQPGSPAAAAGVRPGDEVLAVDGVPSYVDGEVVPGVLRRLTGATGTLTLSLRRPATGVTSIITLTIPEPQPGGGPSAPGTQPPAEARFVDGDLAYVKLAAFGPGAADSVLTAIADLRATATLRGLILDLRGNGGGAPAEVAKLTGAFAHGKTTSYWCDVKDRCKPNRTDDSTPLANLKLVALTDRDCASACDSFSAAVKDLKLGTLVGARTAGVVSGPAEPWLLADGSVLLLPKVHEIGANREVIAGIGVAPDHVAPLTAADLSTGRDPGLEKAISLF